MAAQRSPQQSRQLYREAGPRAEHVKLLNPAAHAADAEWRALMGNADHPWIPAAAAGPVNTIAGRLAPEEIFVAMAPGKQFANPVAHLLGVAALHPSANSPRPTIAPGAVEHVNTIAAQLEGDAT
jgi:hypothetical protein